MSNTLTGREVLRLLADGVGIEEFEWCYGGIWHHMNDTSVEVSWLQKGTAVHFRRKAKTHIVNGFTVPAPETKAPASGVGYFIVNMFDDAWFDDIQSWDNNDVEFKWLRRGLVFLDKDAAIANAKAMCGIDPSKGEEK